MDEIDLAILRELQEDGRLGLSELGRRVGLTAAPVQRRVRALEQEGWIKGYVALVDARRARRTFEVFLEVLLEVESTRALQLFENGVSHLPEITECHRITGSYHYFVRVVTRDAEAFERFYAERMLALPGVVRTTRQVSLKKIRDTTVLPLPRLVRDL